MTASDCLPCELEAAPADAVVFRDETWSCEVAPGYEVPGWYFLRVRRHAEGWQGLNAAEITGFGACCRRLSRAIQLAQGVGHVYFMSFGENYPHFHFLVTARGAAIPPELRGGNILGLRETHRDLPAALAAVPALWAALDAPSADQPGQTINTAP